MLLFTTEKVDFEEGKMEHFSRLDNQPMNNRSDGFPNDLPKFGLRRPGTRDPIYESEDVEIAEELGLVSDETHADPSNGRSGAFFGPLGFGIGFGGRGFGFGGHGGFGGFGGFGGHGGPGGPGGM